MPPVIFRACLLLHAKTGENVKAVAQSFILESGGSEAMDTLNALAKQLHERAELFNAEPIASPSEEHQDIRNQACRPQLYPGYELFLPPSPKVKRAMFRHYANVFGTQHWCVIYTQKPKYVSLYACILVCMMITVAVTRMPKIIRVQNPTQPIYSKHACPHHHPHRSVETGTYKGSTTEWLATSGVCRNVITVELDAGLANSAKRR